MLRNGNSGLKRGVSRAAHTQYAYIIEVGLGTPSRGWDHSIIVTLSNDNSVADLEGGGRNGRPPPLKFYRLRFFFYPILYQNKAQIARESVKHTESFQCPYGGPYTSAVRDFGFRARDVRARI